MVDSVVDVTEVPVVVPLEVALVELVPVCVLLVELTVTLVLEVADELCVDDGVAVTEVVVKVVVRVADVTVVSEVLVDETVPAATATTRAAGAPAGRAAAARRVEMTEEHIQTTQRTSAEPDLTLCSPTVPGTRQLNASTPRNEANMHQVSKLVSATLYNP